MNALALKDPAIERKLLASFHPERLTVEQVEKLRKGYTYKVPLGDGNFGIVRFTPTGTYMDSRFNVFASDFMRSVPGVATPLTRKLTPAEMKVMRKLTNGRLPNTEGVLGKFEATLAVFYPIGDWYTYRDKHYSLNSYRNYGKLWSALPRSIKNQIAAYLAVDLVLGTQDSHPGNIMIYDTDPDDSRAVQQPWLMAVDLNIAQDDFRNGALELHLSNMPSPLLAEHDNRHAEDIIRMILKDAPSDVVQYFQDLSAAEIRRMNRRGRYPLTNRIVSGIIARARHLVAVSGSQ